MSLETMTKLSTYTVTASGGDSTIVFTNIPQMYTDLYIVVSLRSLYNGWADGYLRFGNGGTTEYKTFKSSITSGSSTETYIVGPTGDFSPYSLGGPNIPANHFSNATIYIPNYTSGSFKTFTSEYSAVNSTDDCRVGHATGIWSNTSPITTATFSVAAGFAQYSSVTLYGVKAMRTAMPLIGWASGGIITTDNTYIYHTFAQSNIFVANNSLKDVEYLVVAGGGGGGSFGGGGGAGGLRTQYLSLLDKGAYTIVVGAGGAGGTSNLAGSNGTSSFFNNYTTSGGGGGGGYTIDGASGGSGGGGGAQGGGFLRVGGAGNAGSYYPVEGYAGGRNYGTAAPYGAGGGGGAGAVGVDATSTTSGAGGAGSSSFSAWGLATSTGQNVSGTYWYAGGGGGASNNAYGSGGNGGGGSGANAGFSGTVSTGGGGGGANSSQLGGAGGAGVVIVRYKG